MNNFLKILIVLFFAATSIYSQPAVYEYGIDFLSPTEAILVGADGLILRTGDGGQSWSELNAGVTNVLYANVIVDERTFAAVGENGLILISNDGGSEWSIKTSNTIQHLTDIEIPESMNWIVCGDSGTILKSSDNGETWNTITCPVTGDLKCINFINSLEGFIAGSNSAFLYTSDGGSSWNAIDIGLGIVNLTGVAMLNNTDGTIIGEDGLLMTTRDGGFSWFSSPEIFNYKFNDITFFNEIMGVAVGDNGIIAKTDDGGLTWTSVNSPINSDIESVNFADASIGVSVGEDGIELYSYDGGATWFDAPIKAQLNNNWFGTANNIIKVEQNYPNPFNPSTKIAYTLPFSAEVTIKVFDITGKEISILTNEFQNSGKHIAQFNASGLSSGVYFYTVAAINDGKKFEKTMKMILTK